MLPAKLLQAASGNGGYFIERSLRFNTPDTPYLSRTHAASGNRKTWTFSCWFKRSTLGVTQTLFGCYNGSANTTAGAVAFNASDALMVINWSSSWRTTTQVFRDTSAWYHLVVAFDTTQATASNRVKIYVNGEQVTAFSSSNDPTLDTDYGINQAAEHQVGTWLPVATTGYGHFGGYMTDVYFVDGQALTPSSFGSTDGATGAWKPKRYAGTYGTNGFYLPFSDNASVARLGINNGTTDPFSVATSNDKLLLCAAGLSGSYFVDFADERTITNVSSVSYSTSKKKFGNSSLYFNGSHYLTVPNSSDFDFGSGDFTIEFWVNPDSIASAGNGRQFMAINSTAAPTTDGWFIDIDNTNTGNPATYGQFLLRYRFGGVFGSAASSGVPAGSWTHIAFVRSGTNIYAFRDGVLMNTDSSVNGALNFTTTNALRIGDGYEAAGNITAYVGAADQIRITKGTARYTANFTPETSSFVADLWTAANLSVTAGAGNDSLTDVPTMSLTASNWCTLSRTASSPSNVLLNGNLECGSFYAADIAGSVGTMFVDSGKWYWEVTVAGASTYPYLGITADPLGRTSDVRMWYYAWAFRPSGTVEHNSTYLNSTSVTTGVTSFTNGDVIMFALDCDNKKLWVGKNGTWFNSGAPASGTNQQLSWTLSHQISPIIMGYQSQGTGTVFNFGQRAFAHTAPTGFKTLNTFNLAAPSIKKGSQYFNLVSWSGDNSSTRNITGVGFQPDFTWIKNRTTGLSHLWYDVVRGAGTLKAIASDATVAEGSASDDSTYGYLSAFISDGFSVTKGSTTNGYTNSTSNNYLAWNWRESTTSGFDIVTYTGDGTTGRTVNHSLGAVPKMIIVKSRSAGGTTWFVYHASANASPQNGYLELNSPTAFTTSSISWNNTAPTSSVFTITGTNTNANGTTYVAYLWTDITGFSKFSSYIGTGSADGAFVYTGFRPSYVLIKDATNSNLEWLIHDNKINPHNVAQNHMEAGTATAETSATTREIDILSNGFKIRTSASGLSGAGTTFIYAAFAEMPFKYANAR